jgi:hypothetical protein
MRIASLLALSSLLLVTGCALDTGFDESDARAPALAPASDDPGLDVIKLQAPPVKLMLLANEAPYAALLALRYPVGSYAGNLEHWFGQQPGAYATLAPTTSFSLVATPLREETDDSIRTWVRPLDESFTYALEVHPEDWKTELVRFPDGLRPTLFWGVHPDDDHEILGLALATDEYGKLAGAAWYRSMPPDTSARAFSSQGWVRDLHPALDRDGNPTMDPNAIREAEWYSISMIP